MNLSLYKTYLFGTVLCVASWLMTAPAQAQLSGTWVHEASEKINDGSSFDFGTTSGETESEICSTNIQLDLLDDTVPSVSGGEATIFIKTVEYRCDVYRFRNGIFVTYYPKGSTKYRETGTWGTVGDKLVLLVSHREIFSQGGNALILHSNAREYRYYFITDESTNETTLNLSGSSLTPFSTGKFEFERVN